MTSIFFAFKRNPYDRCISVYHYLKNGGNNLIKLPDGTFIMNKDRYKKKYQNMKLIESIDLQYKKKYFNKYNNFSEFVHDLKNIKNKVIHLKDQYKYICDSNDNNGAVDFKVVKILIMI